MRARKVVVVAAVAAAGSLVAAVAAAGFVTGGALAVFSAAAAATGCRTTPAPPAGTAKSGQLDADQAANAATIIAVGKTMQVPERGWVIAIAVAMQESTLHNVLHGDDWWFQKTGRGERSDSTGLFQQRDGWGPRAVREDPAGASRLFYQALLKIDHWDTLPLYVAAQTVQHSAFPYYYAPHEPMAQQAVADLAGVVAPSPACIPAVAAGGEWALPLPAGKIESPVAEHHDYPAVDLPLTAGETQPVFAVTSGTATPMDEFGVDSHGNPTGCGHGVYVRTGGDEWLYCHLSEQHVRAGQQVAAGVQIGISGWSGGVDPPGPGGAHLHFQFKRGGQLTCPQPIIDALKTGQTPPPIDQLPHPAGNRCLAEWAATRR